MAKKLKVEIVPVSKVPSPKDGNTLVIPAVASKTNGNASMVKDDVEMGSTAANPRVSAMSRNGKKDAVMKKVSSRLRIS